MSTCTVFRTRAFTGIATKTMGKLPQQASGVTTGTKESPYTDLAYSMLQAEQEEWHYEPLDMDTWLATVHFWIATHPEQDAEDVARHFEIDLGLAVELVGQLTEMGLLRDV